MSAIVSGEQNTAPAQNFNPSWMRSAFHGGGGSVGTTPRASMNDEPNEEDFGLKFPPPDYRYTREELLILAPKDSRPPDGLVECPFFVELAQPPIDTQPLSDLEQRLQQNINSSKAMSSLSHAERAHIASGNALGNGYGAGSPGAASSASRAGWTSVKPSWGRGTAATPPSQRGNNSPGVRGTAFAYGRGGSRENGFGSTPTGSAPGTPDDAGMSSPFGQRFPGRGRGGGVAAVARGGSTTAGSFNPRAQGLYHKDTPDRPRAVGTTLRSASEENDENEKDEGGWLTVGSRSPWGRAISQQNETTTPRSPWLRNDQQWALHRENSNAATNGANSNAWRDRASMVQQAYTDQGPNSASSTAPRSLQAQSMPEWMDDGDFKGDVATSASTANSGSFDENGTFRGLGSTSSTALQPKQEPPTKTQTSNATASTSTHQTSSESVNTAQSERPTSAAPSTATPAFGNNWNVPASSAANLMGTGSLPQVSSLLDNFGSSSFDVERIRLLQLQQHQQLLSSLAAAAGLTPVIQPAPAIQEQPPADPEFVYIDPTGTSRGPFTKDNMVLWFKAGYFNDQTLKIKRTTDAEFKTFGDLMRLHGATTPFDYPPEVKPAPVQPAPSQLSSFDPLTFAASNPPLSGLYGSPWYPGITGLNMQLPQFPNQQTGLDALQTQLYMNEQKRIREEAEKIVEKAQAEKLDYQRRLQEKEELLLRQQEELAKREQLMKEKEMEALKKFQEEQLKLEKKAKAIEEERLRKIEEERREQEALERLREREAQIRLQNEERLRQEERLRKAEEAAERERQRLEMEAELAAEKIRQIELKKRAEEEKEAKKKASEVARKVEKSDSFEIEQAWATAPKPRQATTTLSEESQDGWQTISAAQKQQKAKQAPWAAKQSEQAAAEKTLREILAEEERQARIEQERLAKIKKEEPPVASTWGNASQRLQWTPPAPVVKPASSKNPWAAAQAADSAKSYVSPFLDGPSLQAANKVAPTPPPAKKAQPKPEAPKPAPAQNNNNKKKPAVVVDEGLNELKKWFVKRFKTLSSGKDVIDVEFLYGVVIDEENPNEVEDFVMSYLSESKAVKEFVREFLQKRIELRNRGEKPETDDLSSARTAAAAGSNAAGNGSGGSSAALRNKKKKSSRQVLDGAILGFRGAAASDRINQGEIETVPLPTVLGYELQRIDMKELRYKKQKMIGCSSLFQIKPEQSLDANFTSKPKKQNPPRKAGFLDVLRHSDWRDYLLLIFGVLLSFFNGVMLPLNSLIFEGMTNVLMKGQAEYDAGSLDMPWFKHEVLHYCAMYFYLGVAIFVITYAANVCLYTMCERRLHAIRKYYLRAVLRQDARWFDEQQVGALTQKMSSGIEKIKDGIGDKLGVVSSGIGTFIGGLALGFYMCWQLTLAMMIMVPFLLASMYVSGRMLSRATKSEMTAYSSAGAMANEVIAGIRTVIAFNAQLFEIQRYSQQLTQAQKLGIRKANVLAACSAVPLFLMFASMAAAFWYGTILVADGVVGPGGIFGVFWAVLIGTRRLGDAAPHLGAILSARLAARDIFTVIDHEPEINCMQKGGLEPAEIVGKLTFENIEFTYPTRPETKILKGVSFEVEPGQTVALVGHSGCGKSTAIGLLMRFYDQEAGVIKLDGIPIRDYNIQWLRRTIGIVQQEPICFVATVSENIRMGDDSITDEAVEEACQTANAHEFIMQLSDGYDTVIGAGAVQLSGGQKQRIAIARALVRKPKILLLDEATSALDTESERMVQTALDKASKGRTTLCIAHRLSTIKNADNILVFDHGLIIEQGTHDELMTDDVGVYRGMVKAQEIAKGQEDTTLDDVEMEDMIRAFNRDTAQSEEERERRQSLVHDSIRLRQSMISTTTQEPEWEVESAREEMLEEGGMEASLFEILKYSKPEMKSIVVAILFAIVSGFTWPAFSILYGKLFKILSAQAADMVSQSLVNSVWFLLLAVVGAVAAYVAGSLLGKSGEKMSGRLRMDVFKNIMQQDASYFDDPKHGVGNLTSRLATDAPNVQAAVDQRLSEVLTGVVSLIAGISVAFYFGWNMAPIGLATALLLVISQSAVAQYLKFRGQADMDSAIEASRLMTESIANWKTIQALTKQDYMLEAFAISSKNPHRRAIVRGLWQSLSYSLASSFVVFNFAIAYAFGLWLVINNWSTPFVVFQVIEALNMASVRVMAAASYFPEYVRARISAGVMFTMVRQKSHIDNRGIVGETPVIKGDIKLKGVYFSYPNRRRHLVLDGFSMSAKFGETVALVGPSGCGKSTTIQLVERYYDALCGSVRIDDYDIRDLSVKHLRDNIALVGQEPTLFDLTIKENITYGLENVSQEAIERAALLANIHAFVISLPQGYDTHVGAGGGRLSGGQKQRIAIARAIVRDPKILLLDEATSALDTESEKIVQEALDKARLGRTCIVIAHRLSSIQGALSHTSSAYNHPNLIIPNQIRTKCSSEPNHSEPIEYSFRTN
ncbi:unnamed protein product [Caenorhabditis auriculariae]|uniref:ABC-type xenobiotic transporter n=1 Tax=Caenorhabditis auriculariae TaxID=2777116 RepID=A0A8S1HCI9_9PELO|nr:unnamed protein product [Caenorhabditis auriculariae]